jgi:hypothetical protein
MIWNRTAWYRALGTVHLDHFVSDRHVGLYNFVVTTPCEWHLGAELCINYVSYMVFRRVHMLDHVLILAWGTLRTGC